MIYPNLPIKQVNKVIIGADYNEEIYKNLQNLGVEPIFTTKSTNVRQGIQNHADLVLCPLTTDEFLVTKEQKLLKNKLISLGYNALTIDEDLSQDYPNDVFLNCVIIGKHIFYNPKTVSAKIHDFIRNNDLIEVSVRQGYTKCSIAPVSIDSFITDDISIGSRGAEFGFDVLVINKGDIRLQNFDYGFIGGATGKIAEDKMVITGKAENLSDCDKIKSFLFKYDVELIELTNGAVEDIGSIFPLI
ncbi:MAG: hypothetical protein E7555_00495 [Ruminococcaceae bacterium]|nr:hypothetical protein [Oscillospiraceae bacterium]